MKNINTILAQPKVTKLIKIWNIIFIQRILAIGLLLLTIMTIQATNYYSIANGNWNSTATWSLTSGGSAATTIPTTGDIVYIEGAKTVTLNANTASLGSLYISIGSTLTTTSTFTVNATNIYLNGTYINGSTGAITGTVAVGSTGIYQHNQDGGVVPTATWNIASNCIITGYVSQAGGTGGATTPFQVSLSQNFGNFTWNSAAQTADFSFGGIVNSINGNFTVTSTGTGSITLGGTGVGDLTVSGKFIQTGGKFLISSSVARTMTVNGDFTKTGGIFDLTSTTTPANNTILNVKGNFSFTGGTLTETGSTTGSVINFSGTSNQTFTSGGTLSNIVNFAMSTGSIVDFGTSTISSGSTGTFTVNTGSKLITANTNTTGALTTTGLNGTIQLTGTRTYSAAANYTFNGTGIQKTGNGLPTNLTGVITIINTGASGNNTVTLTNAQSVLNGGSINLTSGVFVAGTNLTLNTSTSTIYRSEGSMTGTIQGAGSGTYNVVYTGSSKTCGPELSGGGLNNMTVNLTSGQTLILDQIRVPDGNLTISTGSTLNLSTFTLNRSSAGGTFNIASNATLKIGGTNTLPSNYSTHVIDCASTIEYSGTTQTVANLNSSQSYGNLTLSGSLTKILQTGTTSICNNFTITGTSNTAGVVGLTIGGNVLIDVNAAFTAGAFTHNVSGNWTKSGTFTATGSTINFNSSGNAQSIGASNFNNVIFAGAGTKTATGIFTITGDVTISSNFTAGNFNHTVAGNWTNNGSFIAGSGTFTMTATTAKTIAGSTDSQFYNLIFNGTGSSALGVNTSVTGTLTLTQGLVDINTFTFTIAGVSGGNSGSYVKTSSTGRLKRLVSTGGLVFTFPVGNSAYNPISFSSTATGNGSSDYFSIRVEDGALTTANVNTKTVNRKWYLMSATTGITSLTVTPQYNAGETGASFNASSSPKVGFFTGAAWGYSPTATAAGTGPYTITAAGTAPDASSSNAFVALGSEDAFSASKFSLTVLPPTPYRGVNSSVATIQSQNSQNIPTWVIQSTYFDLTSNKSFTRVGGLTNFAIAAGTHETVLNNIQFLESTWNALNEVYDVNATVTATRTSGENLTDGITPNFVIKDGSIYRPTTNGNWNTVQWEISSNGGTSWINTNLPTNSIFAENDVIQIPSNITLTANTNASFYSLIVFGTLDISSSVTLTLNHSTNDLVDYNISVYGTLKNSGGAILNSNTAYVPVYVYGGTYWHNRDGGDIPIANWNTLSGTTSTCKVTGITSTAITAGMEQNFQNFIWDNASQSATQILNADMTVKNTLTLTHGVITTSSNKVVIDLGGTTASTNNSHVNGNIRIHIPTTSSPTINFPIGDASYYTPLSVAFAGTIVGSGYLDAHVTATQPSLATGLSQSKYINRIWSVTNTNISGFSSFNTTFTFVDADKIGSPNTSSLVVRKRDNNIWAVTSVGSRAANTTECINMTSFSDFAIGEDDCSSTNYIWLGGTSTDWNTASNWCYNQVPTSTVDVTIPSGPVNQPVISASATCNNLTIASSATVTISGSNTLNIFGSLSNNGTLNSNSSTTLFSGSSAQTITGTITFYNLTINNTAGVSANNDLTANGTVYLQSANASATIGALNMGSYTLNVGQNTEFLGIGDLTGIVKRQHTFVAGTDYCFGHQHTTINFTNVPGAIKPTWISCKISLGTVPTWRSQAIKRVYSFAQDGSGNDRTVVHLHYLDSELHDSETDETKLVFWDAYTGPTFTNNFPRSKSNSDATNNWIGLAGMAINFFAPSSTLDYKQWSLGYSNVTKITWTGNGSPTYAGDWSLPGNWNGGVPTLNDDVLIPATLPGDTHGYPTRNLNSGTIPAVANSIEIENGASLTVDSYPITIYGSTGAWTNNGTFVPGSGNVTFNHNNLTDLVTIGGTTNFYNLTFGVNTVMRPNSNSYIGIGGNLIADGTSILEFSSSNNTVEFKGENQTIPNPIGLGIVRGYFNLTFSNTGTSILPTQLNLSGNLTANANINTTTNTTTLICDGSTTQTISGNTTPTLTNFTINNVSGVISSINLALNGALTFITDNPSSNDKGALAMATDKILDMGANATTTGPGDVSGIVRRSQTFNTGNLYTFGNENNGVVFASVTGYPGQTLPTSVSLKTNIGTTSNWSGSLGVTLPNSINRNWEIIQTGGSGTRALMRVHYRDNEIPNGISENNLTIWTSTWIPAYNNFYNKESGRSNYNTDLNFVAIQDVDFGIIPSTWGNFKATLAPSTTSNYTWIGTINTNWNNPSNWTPNSIPDATHGAIIPNTYTTPFAPTLPASATCKSVQLNTGAVLNAAASGGTLTLTGANAAWSAESGSVFNANTSEVIFNANAISVGEASINGTTNFYNLTVASSAVLRPAGNSLTGISGTLTINGTLDAATNKNTIEFNGSSSQLIPNPNGSTPGYNSLILSNSGTKLLPTSLNIFNEFTNNTTGTGTVVASSGTVYMNGNTIYGQTISGSSTLTSFNNLTIDNPSNVVTVSTQIGVNQILNITSGSTLDMGTNALSGTGSTTTTGTGTIYSQNTADYTPLPSGKTWSGTVIYNGTSSQKLVSGTYNNLTVINPTGVTALGDITVNGVLNLPTANPSSTQGVIETSSFILNMGATSMTTGAGDVTGVVKRQHTFEGNIVYSFGNQSTSITFVNFPNTTKPGWISCKISIGTVPTWHGVAVRRYYSFAKDSGSDRTVLKLHYLDSELNTETTEPFEPNESKLELWDAHNGPTWSPVEVHGKSANDATANWVGLAGMSIGYITSSSELNNKQWGLSYSDVVRKTWTGLGFDPHDWALPGNWDGGIPTAADPVLIPAGLTNYPTKNLDPTTYPVTIRTLEIEPGASMAVDTCTVTIKGAAGAWINNGTFTAETGTVIFANDTITNIVTIAGTTNFNNLNVKGNTYILPATNSYMGIGGTISSDAESILDFTTNQNTVEYKGTNQSIVNLVGPSSGIGYHDLIISGLGTKTLPATLNIAGDFTNNGTVDAGTGTVIIKDQGHVQYVGGSTTTTFYNLTIDNTNQLVYATSNFNVSNAFAVNANTTLDMGNYILGGSFTSISGTGTLKTQNTSAAPLPSVNNWTCSVIYNNAFVAQTTATGTYALLQVSNPAGTTASGTLNCNALTIDNGSTLDMNTYALSGGTSISGTGTLKTQNTSATPIPSGKTWPGIVVYNGSEAQTAVAGTFGNIGIDNSIGVSLNDSATVNGTLLINNEKKLIINAEARMTANLITNNANVSGITVKSSSSAANGTLIFNNNSNQPVLATVEMYSKASWDLSNSTPGGKYKWQFFGIPVTGIEASPMFDGDYVRKHNEAGNGSGSTADKRWIQQTTFSVLSPFTGYEITQPAAKTYSFQGQLVNSSFSQSLSYTPGSDYPGQHILSNPYTAAINIEQLTFGDDLDKTVYLYNTGSYADWTQAGTDASPGQYVAAPQAYTGVDIIPHQIPSMQGFMIATRTNAHTLTTFEIPYSAVSIRNKDQQRVRATKSVSEKVYTRIDIKGQRYSDKMWIFTDPNCSHGFDNGYDGSKLWGSTIAPQLWSMESTGDYQVNAVDNMNNTELGFVKGEDATYTLTFTHSNLQSKYESVYLLDLGTNITTDITQSGSTYTFSSQATTQINRFKIISNLNISTGNKSLENNSLRIYNTQQSIFVYNSSSLSGELVIYDIMGRYVQKYPVNASGLTTIPTSLPTGAYLLKTTTAKERNTKQIIIQ